LAYEDKVASVADSDAPSIQSAQIESAADIKTAKPLEQTVPATVLARTHEVIGYPM